MSERDAINEMCADINITELRRLYIAATPGEMKYGIREDDTAWFSIGDPVNGPHIQGDIYCAEPDLAYLTAAHNALPGLQDRLDELEKIADLLTNTKALVDRDARMKREGAAEELERLATEMYERGISHKDSGLYKEFMERSAKLRKGE